MKILLTIILSTITLFTNNASSSYQHEPVSGKLVLNHGAKWKVDKPTSNNVSHLQQIVKAGNVKTLKDYHKAGKALQVGITTMIKECRMQGADHLALHYWLEPLMKKIIKLNQATNVTAAAGSYHGITVQLALFNQYF
jgi:hypothetical protein